MISHLTITPGDASYPARLKEISKPPQRLFVRGNLDTLSGGAPIAIVGTRRCSPSGREASRSFAQKLGQAGATIVSGLAVGVDASAHEGALEGNAPTIAVLGSGLSDATIYPQRNVSLAHRILEAGGVLISEYEDEEPTYPSNFLERNRIIAGLSESILVTEAPARSGALATARHAMEEGRNVYVIPGPIHSRLNEGTNNLLKQGAGCATNPTDILDEIPSEYLTPPHKQGTQQALSAQEQAVLTVLDNATEPLHADDLILRCALDAAALSTALMTLVLSGLVREVEPSTYIRST